MKKQIKKFSKLLLAFAIMCTTVYSASALEIKDLYSNDDIKVTVEQTYDTELNETTIGFKLEEKEEGIVVDKVSIDEETEIEAIIDEETNEITYKYVVSENGITSFKINYSKVDLDNNSEEESVLVGLEHSFEVETSDISDESVKEEVQEDNTSDEQLPEEIIDEEKEMTPEGSSLDGLGEDAFSLSNSITDPMTINANGKEELRVSFNFNMENPSFRLYNGLLVIDLSDSKLKLDTKSLPTASGDISKIEYSPTAKKIYVSFKNGTYPSTSIDFNVTASVLARVDDVYTISAFATGNDIAGNKLQEKTSITNTITVNGTQSSYVEATPDEILKWNLSGATFSNRQGYPGQSLDQFTSGLTPGIELHFSELIIVRENYKDTQKWSTRDNNIFGAIRNTVDDTNRATILTNNETETKLSFGEQSLTHISLFDGQKVPNDAESGDYFVKYHIYNGDEYLYTINKDMKILEAGTEVSYTLNSNYKAIAIGDSVDFTELFSLKGGPELTKDITRVYDIPKGLKLTFFYQAFNHAVNIQYQVGDSDQWIGAPSKVNGRFNFSDIDNITKIRVKNNNTSILPATSTTHIRFKNISVGEGEEVDFKVSEFNYIDATGLPVNYIDLHDQSKFVATVSGKSESVNGHKSQVLTAVVSGNGYGVDNFPTGEVSNVQYLDSLRIGVRGGQELEETYTYVVLPKGMQATLTTSNVVTGNLSGVSHIVNDGRNTQYDIYTGLRAPLNGNFKLSDGRTVVWTKANGDNLQGSERSVEMLISRYRFNTKLMLPGSHEIIYGVGSLTQDDFDVVTTNGMTEVTLNGEIQDKLGATVSRSFETRKTIRIASTFGVGVDSGVQGDLDSGWVTSEIETGTTMPNGKVNFQYTFTNNGTESIRRFEAIDILPYENDSYIVNGNSRGSEYTVNSTGKVTATLNGVVTDDVLVQYALTNTPERFDINGNKIEGTGGAWSKEMPADPTSIRAIRIALVNIDLMPEDKLVLEFEGTLPSNAPRDNSVAFNTIAYRGLIFDRVNNVDVFRVLELPKNGVKATEPENDGELKGQLYIDLDKSGTNNSEPGYNGIELDLFLADNLTKVLKSTISAPSGSITGDFGFNNLEYGIYSIRVKLPNSNSEFITENKDRLIIDSTNPTYAWLQKDGSTEFSLNDVPALGSVIIDSINGAIYTSTPLVGSVTFVDKNGNDMNTSYGKGFKAILSDGSGEIASAVSSETGRYEFKDLTIGTEGAYALKFVNPDGKNFAFYDKNGGINGELSISLKPGIGTSVTDVTDIFITDNIAPVISNIVVSNNENGYNPTEIKFDANDSTTEIKVVWSILGTSFTGSETSIKDALRYMLAGKENGNHTLKVTVTDAAGNEAIESIDFKILANGITFTTRETKDFNFGTAMLSNDEIITLYGMSAVDALGNPVSSLSVDTSKVNIKKFGAHEITITAIDAAGNKDTKVVIYNVLDNEAPIVTEYVDSITIEYGANMTLDTFISELKIKASDNDPAFAQNGGIVNVTGFSEIDQMVQNKTGHAVTFTVSDASGNASAVKTVTVKVIDTVIPVITVVKPVYILNSSQGSLKDTFHNILVDEGYVTVTDLSGIASFTTDYATSVLSTSSHDQEYIVTLSATDKNGMVANTETIIVKIYDDVPPTLTIANPNVLIDIDKPETQLADENAFIAAAGIVGYDNSGKGLTKTDFAEVVKNQTTPQKGLIVTVTVTDKNNIPSHIIKDTVKVDIVDTTKPVITAVTEYTLNSDEEFTSFIDLIGATATDLDLATFESDFADLSVDRDLHDEVYKVTLTAKDKSNNTQTHEVKVTINDNIAPSITEGKKEIVLDMDAQDIDENQFIALLGLKVKENSAIAVISSDFATQVTDQSDIDANYTVTVKVTDGAGLFAEHKVTVTVGDSTKPVITAVDEFELKSSVDVQSFIEVISATATDNDGVVSFESDFADLTIDRNEHGAKHTVTLSASDASNNTTVHEVVVTIIDDIKPLIETDLVAVGYRVGDVVSEEAFLEQIGFVVTDNAATALTTTTNFSSVVLDKELEEITTYTVTITVSDLAGNISQKDITVTVSRNARLFIEANNAIMDIADVNAAIANETLNEKVLAVTNAKAWKDDVENGISDLILSIGNIEEVKAFVANKELKVGDSIDVIINASAPSRLLNETVSATVKITIEDESGLLNPPVVPGEEKPGTEKPGTEKPGTEKPGTDKPVVETPSGNNGSNLPSTGMQVENIASFFGLSLILLGLVLVVIKKTKEEN